MPESGTLADKPAPEIFREMAVTKRDGVLRLAQERKVRVIVFELGRPVFAISNLPEDQIDFVLLRQRKITRDQSAAVRRQVAKEAEIGPKLVELGLVDAGTLEASKTEQIVRIVQNAMLSREGEYMLDLAARVTHEIAIEAPVEQWLLDTARSVPAAVAKVLLGGANQVYEPASADSFDMSPLDSFLLARVTRPMTVDEIRISAELSEDDGFPVIYALYASGLLSRVGAAGSGTSDPAVKEKSIDEIREELDRMLANFRQCDYYDVLQTVRRASSNDIKQAYYTLAKQYHPDRYRHSSDPEIREKLEAVFAQVSRAYDTLKDEKLRADYDRRLGASAAPPTPLPQVNVAPKAPRPPTPISRPVHGSASVPHTSSAPPPGPAAAAHDSAPLPAPDEDHSSPVFQTPEADLTPQQQGERFFQDGLRAYQERDVLRAVHLFREAVRLSPEKGIFHLHLGVALTTNPRWYKEAEKHLLEASRADPMNLQVFLKLGQIYQEGGLKKRAESQYRAALGIDPTNRIARRALMDLGFSVPGATDDKSSGGSSGSTGGLLSKLFKRK